MGYTFPKRFTQAINFGFTIQNNVPLLDDSNERKTSVRSLFWDTVRQVIIVRF